ncbi:MAG: diaminopimelate epimerase [Pseudomonadota bacterium]
MHGLGNDFVILDARGGESPVTPKIARALSDRHRGVGCDQLTVIRDDPVEFARLDFWNSDGSAAAACGNATRCVARLLMDETGLDHLSLKTDRGTLEAQQETTGQVRVNMGPPERSWDEIPLAYEMATDLLPLTGAPAAVGMGNPHCVFVVDDVAAVDLEQEGPLFEHHALFPERTNVEFVQVLSRNKIRMRVWERGGMITQACGSGACASAVVTQQRGLTDRSVTVELDGGKLRIDLEDDGVWMTGPTSMVFEGQMSPQFLDGLS